MKKKFKYIAAGAMGLMMLMPAKTFAQEPDNYYREVVTDDAAIISNLREQLKMKDEQIDKYLKKLISIASNFLYLPYEKYSINDVAIPAFETARGTEYYTKYNIRLTLLKNYKTDTDALIKFLVSHQNEAKRNEYNLSSWAANIRSEFNAMPVVQSYKQYGDGWDETYLGQVIYGVLEQLNNTSGDQAAQRIDAKFANYIRALR